MRLKALTEIYTKHSFAQLQNHIFQKFVRICQILRTFSEICNEIFEIIERCKGVLCVDLGESFPTHIFLQNLASIQQRTSLVKFLVRKSFSVVVRQQAERLVMITETAADQIPCAKVSIATLHTKVQNCERTTQSASGAKWMPSPLNRLLRCFHIGWDDRRYQLIRLS